MMPKKFTAKVFVSGITDNGDGQKQLSFAADYADGANKEWAKYTPDLRFVMVVLDVVAEGIGYGDKFDVLFSKPE